MTVAALLKFQQGITIGTAGVALYGSSGVPVTASNNDDTNVAVWTYSVVDAPPGSAITPGVKQTGATPTWTFTPDHTDTFLVQLDVTGHDGTTATHQLAFGVKRANGRIVPPFQGVPSSINFGSRTRGWSADMEAWLNYVDSIANETTVFNVRNYGAVGNGVADDTAAFTAAIAAKDAAGGGRIVAPAGVYKITTALDLGTKPFVFAGQGHFSAVSAVFGNASWTNPTPAGGFQGTYLYFSNSAANGLVFSPSFVTALLQDFGIIGPGAGTTTGLISTNASANQLQVKDVSIANFFVGFDPGAMENFYTLGLDVRGCDTGVKVRGIGATQATDCRFYNTLINACGDGIVLSNLALGVFHGGLAQGCTRWGVKVLGPNISEVSLDGFWFEVNTSGSIDIDATGGSVTGVRIHKCRSSDTVSLATATGGNVINFLSLQDNFMGGTVTLAANCQNLIAVNNDFVTLTNSSLQLATLRDRYVDVRDYGAVGNGSTDDTAALQNAINIAGKAGKFLRLESGKSYKTTAPLLISMDAGNYGFVFGGDSENSDMIGGSTQQPTIRMVAPTVSTTTASITSEATVGADYNLGLSGLATVLASWQAGDQLLLSNCAVANNNGCWTVIPSSVDVVAGTCTVLVPSLQLPPAFPDANSGSIHVTLKKPVLNIRSRGVTIRNLTLDGANTASCLANCTPDTVNANTNIQFRAVGGQNAFFGITIGDLGPRSVYSGNCESYEIFKCYFQSITSAGVYLVNSAGQAKQERITNCTFTNGLFGILQVSGSIHVYGCAFSGVTSSCVFLGRATDYQLLHGNHAEGCARFLQTAVGADLALTIVDGLSFDSAGALAADGEFIQFNQGGGLILRCCEADAGVNSGISVGLNGNIPAWRGIQASIEHCCFGRTTPGGSSFVTPKGNNPALGGSIWYSRGNRQDGGDTNLILVPDGTQVVPGVSLATSAAPPFNLVVLGLPNNSLTLATGNNDNVPYQGWTSLDVTDSGGAMVLRGLAGGIDGMVYRLRYSGSQSFTNSHQNAGSSAANRFICNTGADIVATPPAGGFIEFEYRYNGGTTNRWYVRQIA